MGHRIALVASSYHPWVGGVEEHVRSLATSLTSRGNEVVVWTVDRGEHLGRQVVDGVEVRYLPTPMPARRAGPLARFLWHAPAAWRLWVAAFRDFRPDLLHVHCFGPNGVYAAGLARRFQVPLVVTSHGETFADDHSVFDESALMGAALRRTVRRASAVTGVSAMVLADLHDRFGLVGGTLVPNGVDLLVPPSTDPGREPDGPPIVLAVGRLEHNKGFDLLLDAFAAAGLPRRASLVIAGDGSSRQELEQQATRLGIAGSVRFLGRLAAADVSTWMSRAAVVVVPSRVEAFGIVALEAWRSGTPLVMTSRGGARDLMTDGVDTLLVDPTDTASLSAAIERVLTDPELADRLSRGGQTSVRQFGWEAVASAYERVYADVLNSVSPLPDGAPPKVVVLDHTAQLGGAELALLRLLEAIGDRAHVDVVLFDDGPLATRLRDSGQSIRVVPLAPHVNTTTRDIPVLRTLATGVGAFATFLPHLVIAVYRARPEVLYATSLKSGLIGLPLARLVRVPLVWHVHDRISADYLPNRAVRLVQRFVRRSDAVIANSAATAATLHRDDVVVAAPGLAADQVRSEPRPRPEGRPVIGMLGRISPTKDQLTFVRAAARVITAYPDVDFRIIGDPAFGADDYADRVRAEITALGLDGAVTLTGFVDNPTSALDELTLSVHCAAVPEPFGQVVTEAMARGVPVIATSGGGVDEILEISSGSQPVGWVVPSTDEAALARTICEALADPAGAEARGRAGWTRVRERYAIERTADIVLDVWSRVARRRARARRSAR